MHPVLLAIAALAAWALRRSVARRVERASLLALPCGRDGIIDGAHPIDHRGSRTRAVLILHGFGDTPQTVGYLAAHLHGLGFTVRAPLLAGHGRTLREFGRSTADQWLHAAERELLALQREYESVGVIGVSMGGALAVILAARDSGSAAAPGTRRLVTAPDSAAAGDAHPARPLSALVLIAPYLSMRAPARRLAACHWMLSPFIRYLPSREEASILDADERRRNRGFGTVTPRLLRELQRLVSRARGSLGIVTTPTLMIQSRTDNRIDPDAATGSFDRLGSPVKRFEWTEGGHVITVDVGRERVLSMTGDWLLTGMGAGLAASRGASTSKG